MVNPKFSVQLWKWWSELMRGGRDEKLGERIALNPRQQVSSCFAPRGEIESVTLANLISTT